MTRLTAALALVLGLVAASLFASPAVAAGAGQRVDMKVLLLSKDGNEPTFDAWQSTLEKQGVPYKAIVADRDADITAEFLASGTTHARYQAVIVSGAVALGALTDAERTALDSFERAFGIRRVLGYVYPSSATGLTTATTSGNAGGTVAQLTAAGRSAFAYLKGAVPIDGGAWGYLGAFPMPGANFETLVAAPDGSVVVGINRTDGREDLITTVDANRWHSHWQLLAHGMIAWATRGAYLGYERNYLTMHVDDVFLPNDRWDTTLNRTVSTNPIRMRDKDVTRAASWSQTNGFKLDMAFNGEGSVDAGTRDKLTSTFLSNKEKFRWLNHTYGHTDLDDVDDDPSNGLQPADLATITDQIKRNIDWARSKSLTIDPTELVTGEHSGLQNPSMPQALTNTGIRWIASDNSRSSEQSTLGSALTVPRHPTGIYFNVGTRTEQLDEYNWIYYDGCQNTATTTCLSRPATWDEYVNSEARIMMRHVLDNDPRPHYVHQSNLAEDGTMYPVLDEVLRRYRDRFVPPLEQPTQRQASDILQRQAKWNAAVGAGAVSAYMLDGKMVLESTRAVHAPVTGSTIGTRYDGTRNSGWAAIGTSPTVLTVTATG